MPKSTTASDTLQGLVLMAALSLCPSPVSHAKPPREESPADSRRPASERVEIHVVARDLSVSEQTACVVDEAKKVRCWPVRDADRDISDWPTQAPPVVKGLSAARLVAAGRTSCAALWSGEILCWVRDDSPRPPPPLVVMHPPNWAVSIDISGSFGAIADAAGEVSVFQPSSEIPEPVPLRTMSSVLEVAAGAMHMCARHEDGRVSCVADPESMTFERCRDIGFDEPLTLLEPFEYKHLFGDDEASACRDADACVAPPEMRHIVDIDAGGPTCAVFESGRVACWGMKTLPNYDRLECRPVELPVIADAVSVAVGDSHVCALRKNGRVWCFGHNDRGQLGVQRSKNAGERIEMYDVPGLKGVVELDAGGDVTCARLRDGKVLCWGGEKSPAPRFD